MHENTNSLKEREFCPSICKFHTVRTGMRKSIQFCFVFFKSFIHFEKKKKRWFKIKGFLTCCAGKDTYMLTWTDTHRGSTDWHTQRCDKSLVTALIEERDRTIELKWTEQEFPFQTFFTSQLTCEITAALHRFGKNGGGNEGCCSRGAGMDWF